MTIQRITYRGPSSLAVRAATVLADAEGVELTSAQEPEHPDGLADKVLLALTVEGTREAVIAAVSLIQAELPADASVTIEEDRAGAP